MKNFNFDNNFKKICLIDFIFDLKQTKSPESTKIENKKKLRQFEVCKTVVK